MTRQDKIDALHEAYGEELRTLTDEQLQEEWENCWAYENLEGDED
jgi:hypothetical protein